MLAATTAYADYEGELYAKAKKEGELVWYTTLIVKRAVRPIVAAFQKKYPGIKVRYSRANSSDTAIKILSEGKANRILGDVFDGTSNAEALKDANLVEKWTPKNAGMYPAEFRDPDGFWSATHLYYLTPGYNTSLVSKADAPRPSRMAWSPRSTTSGAAGFIGNVLITMAPGPWQHRPVGGAVPARGLAGTPCLCRPRPLPGRLSGMTMRMRACHRTLRR